MRIAEDVIREVSHHSVLLEQHAARLTRLDDYHEDDVLTSQELKKRVRELEDQRVKDREVVAAIKSDTEAIVALLKDAQGAWRTVERLGKLAKPVAWVAGVMVSAAMIGKAIWDFYFGGRP